MLDLTNITSVDIFYSITVWVTLGLIGFLFLIEIFLKLNDVPYDNVNYIIRDWASKKFYFITFFAGVVSAHLFLGTTFDWFDCRILVGDKFECHIFDVIVVAGLSIVLLLIGLLTQKGSTSNKVQYLLYTVGLIVGHFVWSMNNYN